MTESTQKLFVLEASGDGRLFSINPDGSGKTVLVSGCPVPDGVAVDVEAGHVYWTNMGAAAGQRRLDRTRRTSTEATAPRSFPAEARTPPSNFISTSRAASCTGATAKACGSCAATSTGRTSRRLSRPGKVTTTAATRPNGASESPSTTSADTSTGRRRVRATPDSAGSCGPGSTFPTGESAAHRSDIEVVFKDLPEPIDLEIDHTTRIAVLDRPRRPAARQHRQPGSVGRHRQHRTRNRGDPPDGRHRHRTGSRPRPHVRHRPRRQHLRRRPRRIRSPADPRPARQPHRHRLRRGARREPSVSRHRVRRHRIGGLVSTGTRSPVLTTIHGRAYKEQEMSFTVPTQLREPAGGRHRRRYARTAHRADVRRTRCAGDDPRPRRSTTRRRARLRDGQSSRAVGPPH